MKHYDGLKILSYNAILHFINTNRNYGKTWCFKKRAVRRAVKKGKKTIWIRRFKKEVKECLKSFFSSKDLQKFCGLVPYDKEKKTGNFKQNGNKFYVLRGRKWIDFLTIYALSDANAIRSVDDVDVDTIVFDEYTTTIDKYNRYRGDEVTDFIDIFFTSKREHQIKCFLLGNKESVFNPYLNYFKIPILPQEFEGIKTFKNGSILVQQINNKQKNDCHYDSKLNSLLAGTSYGSYLNDSYKMEQKFKKASLPNSAVNIFQCYFNKCLFAIYLDNGKYYISSKVNKGKEIFCDKLYQKFVKEKQLLKTYKKNFTTFATAISDNRVYYENMLLFEQIQAFYKWLAF